MNKVINRHKSKTENMDNDIHITDSYKQPECLSYDEREKKYIDKYLAHKTIICRDCGGD